MVSAATPTLAPVSLEPRQVMLGKQNMKKKNSDSSETLENGSNGKTLELNEEKKEKKKKKKTKSRESDQMSHLLLQSIASYLDSNGFSKTLSAFRSEAPTEIDGWKLQSLDLEAVCRKYVETSDFHIEANIKESKKPEIADPQEDLIAQKDVEPISKKKKKSNASDANMETNGNLSNAVTAELHVENEEKKNKAESKKSKSHADDSVHDILLEDSPVKSEKKKKKSKSVSGSLGGDIKQIVSETFHESVETTNHESKVGELPKKSKDKKVKDKLISDPLSENIQQDSSGALQEVIKEKSKDLQAPEFSTETVAVEIPLDETNIKSKDKKKKKKVKSLSTDCGGAEYLNITDTEREGVLVSEKNVAAVEKKGSKKRKRPATEETDSGVDDEIRNKGPQPCNIDGSKEKNENEQLPEDGLLEGDGHLKPGKKRKAGVSEDCVNKHLKDQLEDLAEIKETPGAHDSKKEVDRLANGRGDTSLKTTKKELKSSAEPKTVSAFQRVKAEEVEFADERLQDNSYWAKGGADSGYGAKAQEVLGQVRGRDFRHEKTKKKRGSYRGGLIDLQSHSIKFNYSDEDE